MSDEPSMKAYLADHPRMIGVLFTMMLLLSQASSVMASDVSAIAGP